jgi:hypothetical protein
MTMPQNSAGNAPTSGEITQAYLDSLPKLIEQRAKLRSALLAEQQIVANVTSAWVSSPLYPEDVSEFRQAAWLTNKVSTDADVMEANSCVIHYEKEYDEARVTAYTAWVALVQYAVEKNLPYPELPTELFTEVT